MVPAIAPWQHEHALSADLSGQDLAIRYTVINAMKRVEPILIFVVARYHPDVHIEDVTKIVLVLEIPVPVAGGPDAEIAQVIGGANASILEASKRSFRPGVISVPVPRNGNDRFTSVRTSPIRQCSPPRLAKNYRDS